MPASWDQSGLPTKVHGAALSGSEGFREIRLACADTLGAAAKVTPASSSARLWITFDTSFRTTAPGAV